VDRFRNGSEAIRDRKLHIMIQLGNSLGLSLGGWLFLRILSFLFQLTGTGRDLPMNLQSTRDRYAFPAFKVASFFKTTHFGGSLQKSRSLPKNYVAAVSVVSLDHLPNLVPRIFSRFQQHLADSIVDMTYFLEGDQEDELPERALCSLRQVHANPEKIGRDPHEHLFPLEGGSQRDESSEDAWHGNPPPISLSGLYQHSMTALTSVASMISTPIYHARTELTMTTMTDNESMDGEEIPHRVLADGNELDPAKLAVESVMEILETVQVPMRVKRDDFDSSLSDKVLLETDESDDIVMTMVHVLRVFGRCDIERFLRDCDFDVKESAVRLVQTAAWRGRTFPLDKRRFRIELQSGQFFQQGIDLEKNPVFYFRNKCRGPWRGDEEAVISAVLCRLELSLVEVTSKNPYTMATLIVLMGAPRILSRGLSEEEIVSVQEDGDDVEAEATTGASTTSKGSVNNVSGGELQTNNPRISMDERWTCHTNKAMIGRLFGLLRTHYPARLSKVLIVKGRGKNMYYGTSFEGKIKLNKILDDQEVRDKIKFVSKTSELTNYVAIDELCTIVGGKAPIVPSSYEF
jgi:hypothetical protein